MLLINKTLLNMSKGVRKWILLIVTLRMLSLVGVSLFATAMSGFLGNLLQPQLTTDELSSVIFLAFISSIIILAGELLAGEVEAQCTARARISLRERIFAKILQLDVGRVDKIGAANAAASAVDGVEYMQLYYSRYLPGLVFTMVAPVFLFFRLWPASQPAAVFLTVVALGLIPANTIFRKLTEKLKTEYWSSFQELTAHYLESLRGLTTLKLFNRDSERTDVLRVKAEDFKGSIMSVMKVNFTAMLFNDAIIYLAVFGGLLIVTRQLATGAVSLESALVILMLGYAVFGSLRQLMNTTHSALMGVAASQKIAELLEIDSARPFDGELAGKHMCDYGGIRIKDVSFAYAGRDAVLNNVSIDIPRDKVTALVGRSGCGKSTVAGLLMRFFDPASGRIFFEGEDYISFAPESLREKIVMVPQFVSIFSGTVADNLRFANPNASDAEMLKALDLVHLGHWIRKQPDGLQTDVGDAGGKLSGGQRQKIGIARVLLCDAPYIIFDEATSSVDAESEQDIWDCIADLAKTRTLIIISHRLSTIRQAEQIYVFANGNVAEKGRHDELIESGGLYSVLVNEQTALETNGAERVTI